MRQQSHTDLRLTLSAQAVTQHLPEVYLQEFGMLRSSWSLIQEQRDLVELLLRIAGEISLLAEMSYATILAPAR
jgi:hypothetical protein